MFYFSTFWYFKTVAVIWMGQLTILVISQVDNAHVLIMFLDLNVMFVQLGGMVSQTVKVRQSINIWFGNCIVTMAHLMSNVDF